MKKLIIVLAHPRTGSSLLMQTLRQLGIEVIGEFERSDLPREANPKGYFEDRHALNKGLTNETINKIENCNNEVVALKIALRKMVINNREDQWQYLLDKQTIILMPIRPPLESAVSNLVFNNETNEIMHFKKITTYLLNYRLEYKKLAETMLNNVPELIPNTLIVDYHLAHDNPQLYIQNIVKMIGISVTEIQFNNANSNIDPGLYRHKQQTFKENIWEWHRKIGADQIYNLLLKFNNPWKEINDLQL